MTWAGLNPPYATIVADPPWAPSGIAPTRPESWRAQGAKHYGVMSTDDICNLPVAGLAADSAHLWLWAINALMEDGFRVVRAWGFTPLTLVTWCKPGPGIGHYVRNNTEHAIFAVRGRPMVPPTKALSSWLEAPRSSHSTKPDSFFDLVQLVSPAPYVELFSRSPLLGWDHWGFGYESERVS